jgi:hypothetical protein
LAPAARLTENIMGRSLFVLLVALVVEGCSCSAGAPQLTADAGVPDGPRLPDCTGSAVNDPISDRCVPGRGVTTLCPDNGFDEAHPWAVAATEAGAATIYVAQGGTGSGSKEDPMGTVGSALTELQDRGGLILLGDGEFVVETQPNVTEEVAIIGRCASGTMLSGQVRGRWHLRGFGERAVMKLSGLHLAMGLQVSNLRAIHLNQVVLKADSGQTAEVGIYLSSESDEPGTEMIASGVEISHWAAAIVGNLGVRRLEVHNAKLEKLGRSAIYVHRTTPDAHIEVTNSLLTTGDDAEVILGVGHTQGFGQTLEERERVVDTFSGTVLIRGNDLRGVPEATVERLAESGAEHGIAVRYPRLGDNVIEVRDNTVTDVRRYGIWLRQYTVSGEGADQHITAIDDDSGVWTLAGNHIERVGRGIVAERITGRLEVVENAVTRADDVGITLRNPGTDNELANNGVVEAAGRGIEIGPAFTGRSAAQLSANRVVMSGRTGVVIRTRLGGSWTLAENEVNGAVWGFAFEGRDADDQPSTVSLTGNSVLAVDVGFAAIGLRGELTSERDRVETPGIGFWIERSAGGSVSIDNPALLQVAGAAIFAIGNNAELHFNNLTLPSPEKRTLPFDDGAEAAGAAIDYGVLALDNRSVVISGLDAAVNSVPFALLIDRTHASQERYGVDVSSAATMRLDGLAGASGVFRLGESGGASLSGDSGDSLGGLAGAPVPRGLTRGAP